MPARGRVAAKPSGLEHPNPESDRQCRRSGSAGGVFFHQIRLYGFEKRQPGEHIVLRFGVGPGAKFQKLRVFMCGMAADEKTVVNDRIYEPMPVLTLGGRNRQITGADFLPGRQSFIQRNARIAQDISGYSQWLGFKHDPTVFETFLRASDNFIIVILGIDDSVHPMP